MKKKTLLIYVFVLFSAIINAQHNNKDKEKIRALKIAYLTEKLDLTSNEAEKFWPIFNQHHKQRRELFKFEKKELRQKVNEGYDFTNAEAEEILQKINDCREKRHKNKIAFHKELRKILPAKKILILEVTERQFNKKLMHKLKNKEEK